VNRGDRVKMTLEQSIRRSIESVLKYGDKKFIIFPFGEVGIKVKACLNTCYGIEEAFIIDNNLSKYNSKIKELSFLKDLNSEEYVVLLASTNLNIYDELRAAVLNFFPIESVVELSITLDKREKEKNKDKPQKYTTTIGKYSYGPLCCNHRYIKSIGSFCSIAKGVEVVRNHPTEYITTHAMIYAGREGEEIQDDYIEFSHRPWYFEGIQPKNKKTINKRITIGNDVWLGQNVIITNGANIGNGVIAAAGAVITKDVPDYAVVAGVPARIVRYRYTPEQIQKLNKIAWWDWTDEQIRERYDDFYLDIESFLEKYHIE